MRISNGIFVGAVAIVVGAILGSSSCYKPEYASNPDAKMGFRCHKTDSPACPPTLVCCLDGVCGEDLKDTDEGWCIPPPPPTDMSITGLKYWPFPSKGMYFSGVYTPAQLTGYDDQQQWRCTRDDTNPTPSDSILHMGEVNDFPESAIVLPNPLPIDPAPTVMGAYYQICPDKTAPDVPDVDVYKFKLLTQSKVIAEIKYMAAMGDLDIAIFRMDTDPETNAPKPTLIAADATAVDNGCVEVMSLAVGTYYVVVRGTVRPEEPGKYTMNDYRLRVFTVDPSGPGYSCNAKKDMGP